MTTGAQIWVLADDRAGNVAQALGVAEALGVPFKVFAVRYTRWGELHNLLRWSSRRGLTRDCRKQLEPPWPTLVIGAGRRTAPLALWLKRKFGCQLVQVMNPGWPGRRHFDLIAAPAHDDLPDRPNVLHTLGSCHRARPELLAEQAALWAPRLAALPRPYVMVTVGGATKENGFGPERCRQLVAQVNALHRALGGALLVTTSRRSGLMVEEALAAGLTEPRQLHRWSEGGDNPYFGFLGLADVVVATGDSMNMCTEACATGGPVYIFAPPGMVNDKHARLHQTLYAAGLARPLEGDHRPWTHPPLNAAIAVAEEIRRRGMV